MQQVRRRMNRQVLAELRKTRLAVSYARFSTDKQESTTEQFGINDDIGEDEGIEVVEHFKDEGVSRSVGDRPGLLAMLAYLEAHPEVGYIIVNELERLTSGIEQRAEITRLCQRLDITIVTEDMGQIDPFDETKMLEADQRSVASKQEVVKVSRRTRRNLRKKVQGGRMAFRPPFGVRMKPLVLEDGTKLASGTPILIDGKKVRSGEVELHPEEHPWLVRIFDWAHEGKSSDWIAKQLTTEGVPTKNSRSGGWRGNTVNGILDNEFYKGEWVWGRTKTVTGADGKKHLEPRPVGDPGRVVRSSPLGAIIDPVLWDTIHERRMKRREQAYKTRQVRQRQVLDEFVWCGQCGHRMYGRYDNPKSEKNLTWRYYCASKRSGYTPKPGFESTCTTTPSMTLKDAIAALGGLNAQSGRLPTVVAERTSVDSTEVRRRRLELRIETANTEHKRVKQGYKKGLLDDDDLAEANAERDATIAQAQAELASLDAEPQATIVPFEGDVATMFRELSASLADTSRRVEDRAQLLRDAGVERIYLDAPDVRIQLSL